VVCAKRPFAGPQAVLAYLAGYTHRAAISNSRLIALDGGGATLRWKDHRARGKAPGNAWIKPMTLDAAEFIRRFFLHILPSGFHRIRHYGFLASPGHAATIDRLRELIAAADLGRPISPRFRQPARRRRRLQQRSSLSHDLSLLRRTHARSRDLRPRRTAQKLHGQTRRNRLLMTTAPTHALFADHSSRRPCPCRAEPGPRD
jgi:hypothetical protein